MIQVQNMKPFYTKVTGDNLRLVFAYQYFSIMKEDELYHFIPVEGKEMIINLNTMQIENLSEIFVFQRGNRFVRYPLYQLLVQSDIHEHLLPIIDAAVAEKKAVQLVPTKEESEVDRIIHTLEEKNLERLIDEALAERNESLFYDLVIKQEKLKSRSS
nr:IDEAL domain-containing protein [Lysinibacillus timonensis]